jgi:peptide/nickel transport system substrate-binding protein
MWNTAPEGDPDFFISRIFKSGAGANYMGYENAELDELAARGKTTFDSAERKKIYDRIQEIIYEESPVIVLFHKSMVSAARSGLQNYRIHPAEKHLVTQQLGWE